ncbi:MAG: SrfA family protein [Pikeienuella sp.]
MKRGVFLAESPLDSHRPLGAFGQPVHMSYVQLRAAVAQRLGERHANLFAKPQIDDRSGVIRWVAPVDGDPKRWADLDAQEQADRALDLQIMKAEFDTYLSDLKSAEGGKAFASVLENALQTPNDGHLHFVGDQPVVTFWGFTELGGESFAPLTAAPPVAPVAAAAPLTPADDSRRGLPVWLWWLLPLLLLLLLLLWWLFWPTEEKTPPPAVDPVEETQPEVLEEGEPFERLEDGRLRLRDGRIVRRDDLRVDEQGRVVTPEGEVLEDVPPEALVPDEDGGLTDPPALDEDPATEDEPLAEDPAADDTGDGEGVGEDPVEDTPPSEEEPTDETPEGEDPAAENAEDETPAPEEQGAEDPAADTPADEATDPEAPEAPADPAAEEGATPPGEELQLPDPADPNAGGAANGADGAPAPFMEGEWRSRSGLTDENGKPLDQRYEFDDKGQGQSVIRRSDGTRCTAPAEAVMRNGKLVMVEKSDPTCPDGQKFKRSETVCERDASGKTRCKGDGFDVRIERNTQ